MSFNRDHEEVNDPPKILKYPLILGYFINKMSQSGVINACSGPEGTRLPKLKLYIINNIRIPKYWST